MLKYNYIDKQLNMYTVKLNFLYSRQLLLVFMVLKNCMELVKVCIYEYYIRVNVACYVYI